MGHRSAQQQQHYRNNGRTALAKAMPAQGHAHKMCKRSSGIRQHLYRITQRKKDVPADDLARRVGLFGPARPLPRRIWQPAEKVASQQKKIAARPTMTRDKTTSSSCSTSESETDLNPSPCAILQPRKEPRWCGVIQAATLPCRSFILGLARLARQIWEGFHDNKNTHC